MHYVNHPDATTQPARVRNCNAPGLRTYRQVAEILTEREGKPISTAEVGEICRTAERKIARALLRDPEAMRLFGSRPTHGQVISPSRGTTVPDGSAYGEHSEQLIRSQS